MTPNNEAIRNGLNRALGCLFQLADRGLRVVGVEVTGRNPVVRIDGDPDRKLHGAMVVRRTVAGVRQVMRVALIDDVQVEWSELADAQTPELEGAT
jgi:hypothetical protein